MWRQQRDRVMACNFFAEWFYATSAKRPHSFLWFAARLHFIANIYIEDSILGMRRSSISLLSSDADAMTETSSKNPFWRPIIRGTYYTQPYLNGDTILWATKLHILAGVLPLYFAEEQRLSWILSRCFLLERHGTERTWVNGMRWFDSNLYWNLIEAD